MMMSRSATQALATVEMNGVSPPAMRLGIRGAQRVPRDPNMRGGADLIIGIGGAGLCLARDFVQSASANPMSSALPT